MRLISWLLLNLLFAAAAFSQTDPAPPQVEFFSPQGTVKGVRQVAARFSDPMVAFGDPRLPEPFRIDCPESGKARWADAYNWIYDLARDLPAGVVCRFTLKEGLKTLGGQAIGGERQFSFSTGGPAIRASLPAEGESSIDENQVFILALDTEAEPGSMATHVRCEINGIAEQIGVEFLSGEAREQVLRQRRLLGYDYVRLLSADAHPLSIEESKAKEAGLVVLKCQRTLPPATNVRLVWGAGIKSMTGIATEQDQKLAFTSRSSFTARFSCRRVKPEAECLPMLPMYVTFSAQVAAEQAERIQLKGPDGKIYPPAAIDKKQSPWVEGIRFAGLFPEQAEFAIELPEGLTDDSGRFLENAAQFPLKVRTDESPPLAKFPGKLGIIELKAGATLPVTLRNLEPIVQAKRLMPGQPGTIPGKMQRVYQDEAAILDWLKRVEKADKYRQEQDPKDPNKWLNRTGAVSVFDASNPGDRFEIPKPSGEREFEVVGIPLKEAGFYVVELANPRLGAALLDQARPRYVATAALVTNLSAHFKWGRGSSLVWVTTLDAAEPVAGARVTVRSCKGKHLWQGQTDPQGLAHIGGGNIPAPGAAPYCPHWGRMLFISVRTEDDMSFVLSSWHQGIEPWDFNLAMGSGASTHIAHTVFDRMLLRAGETVHMKHILRKHTMAGFAPADTPVLPAKLMITHAGSGQRYELPLKLDSEGWAANDWTIPKEAKYGVYQVTLTNGKTSFDSGSFRVEAFRVPTMKAVIQPPAEPLVNAIQTHADLLVSYLSGGGAGDLPVKLRTLVQPKAIYFPDYEDFSFGGEDIHEGIEHVAGADSYFPEVGETRPAQPRPAQVLPLKLDRGGAARATITDLPNIATAHEIVVELEYQDANGEILTAANRIDLWPAKINLGIRMEGWTATEEHVKFQVIALDLRGKPMADQSIAVDLFRRITYSHRKRLIGGFYGYESMTETERIGEACQGTTDARGLLLCDVKSTVSGEVLLRAQARDDLGNRAVASRTVWAAGKEDWWFEASGNDRMDVLPEQKGYEPGETARFQVRMPFREATALITIEREGIIDSYVSALSGKVPVIEVPIKDHYAPNVFVSVLAVRGRVGEVQPTALVDLGKPAFRLGVAPINVGWKPYELQVRVSTDKEVYKVRDKARAKIAVCPAMGGALPKQAEIALAAVDEGLLELMPNRSWQLLETMMQKRGIEVTTATAQMQVVGKRHYGRKAVPQGGGGGRQAARELFDILLVWSPRVALDDKGEAEIEVPLNDSLTSFRIVAIANAGMGLFGTGQTTIRSTQEVMLHAGLPPLMREGDRFTGVFTVRNASDRTQALEVSAQLGPEPRTAQPLPPITLELASGEAQEVGWDIEVPVAVKQLHWEVAAQDRAGTQLDRLKLLQEVIPAYPVRVYQATLTQIEKPFSLPVQRPADAIPGRGGVRLSLRAKLGEGLLGGVIAYITRYPYTCLEQQLSKSVALRDKSRWEEITNRLPSYIDSEGLLRYFPADRLLGSDSLTAYVLAIAYEAGWSIPESGLSRLKEGLKGFVAGRILRYSALPTADLSLRKLAAIEALSRYNEATPDMLGTLTLDPNLWPTSAVLDWMNILKRMTTIPEQAARLKEANQILRSRLNFQGTILGFSTERSDRLWWLMVSTDVNAVRGVLALLDDPLWRKDLPRIARGALGRQQHGHWDTTPANAFGVLAMEKFSAAFEAVPVGGLTEARLDEAIRRFDWGKSKSGDRLEFGWSEGEQVLHIKHQSHGKPWAFIESRAAIPLKQPLASGYTIGRRIIPLEQKQAGVWSRGDVARVQLALEAQADMTWVVVDDPIPAGASILGTGLGRDSELLTEDEQRGGWVWPAFEERRFDSFRAYYEWVPKGQWAVEYTVRFNSAGTFELPATRVEALYAPEMFGERPNERIAIRAVIPTSTPSTRSIGVAVGLAKANLP